MQKSILLLFVLTLTIGFSAAIAAVNATANTMQSTQTSSAMKVATIAKMYQQDASNQGQDYPVTLEQYSNQQLQAAMQLERDYFDREQMSCHIGYDVLWNSQDPDYEQDRQFTVTAQGSVKVSLAQGSNVYYELACDDFACYVANVILDEDGTSLKNYLVESCS